MDNSIDLLLANTEQVLPTEQGPSSKEENNDQEEALPSGNTEEKDKQGVFHDPLLILH